MESFGYWGRTLGFLGVCALGLWATDSGMARADTYPTRPVTLVVAGPPSGGTDFMARLLAEKLTERWGQSVMVENRAGASGIIGTRHVKNAPPDGYTLILGHTATHAIVPAVYEPSPYDPVRDFTPISLIGTASDILVVPADSPINSLEELLAEARARPSELTYGSPGVGLPQHLLAVRMGQIAGAQMRHIPYKGSSPALNDLIGGRLSFMVVTPAAVMPFIKDGRVRAIAVNSEDRSPLLPEIPTFTEMNIPGLSQPGWFGIFAPAGLPSAVRDELSNACVEILALPEVRNKMAALYVEPVGSSTAEFEEYQLAEVAKWTAIVEQSGVRIQ